MRKRKRIEENNIYGKDADVVSGEELMFQDYFKGNFDKALRNCRLLSSEYRLYGAYSVLTREVYGKSNAGGCIGRIDFIFMYKSKKYIAEVKYYPFLPYEFWDALKVVGYTEYYKWQTEDTLVYPAVMIPSKKVKLEHQITAGRLGVTIFLITKLKDGDYAVKMLDDRPHWKQGSSPQ